MANPEWDNYATESLVMRTLPEMVALLKDLWQSRGYDPLPTVWADRLDSIAKKLKWEEAKD